MNADIIKMFDLTGKVAVVTGASQGFGWAAGLAKAGAFVVCCARSEDKLSALAS